MNRRNTNQQSRFDPQSYSQDNTFNGMPAMDLSRHFPSINTFQSATPSLTAEQIAFEKEFKKWELGFETWKKAYASHPDRDAYRQYENKFLDVRVKLMEKRAQIYGKNILKTVLENELDAASRMAESILEKFSEPRNDRFSSQQSAPEGFRGRPDRSRSPYVNRSPPRQDSRNNPWDGGNNPWDGGNNPWNGGNRSGNNSFNNSGGSPFSGSGNMMGSNRFSSNSGNSGGSPFNNSGGSRFNAGNNSGGGPFNSSDANRFNAGNNSGGGPFNSSDGNRFNAGNNSGNGPFNSSDANRFNAGNNSSGNRFNNSAGNSFNSAVRFKPFQQQNRGNQGQRQDRNDQRGSDRKNFKSQESNRKKLPVMTETQLKKELERKDVYPFNSWVPAKAPKLALVGKRKKVKNNKIAHILQMIASGEYQPSSDQERQPEPATHAAKMSGAARRKYKLLIKKDESEWTEADKIFMADIQHRRAERAKIFGESQPDALKFFTDPAAAAGILSADTSDGNNYSSDQMA